MTIPELKGRELEMAEDEPIKILFCIDALIRGGTELQLLGLIDRLDRSQFSPYLLTIRPSSTVLSPSDCPHLAWHIPQLFSPTGLHEIWRLTKFLRKENFSVVQTYFQDSTIFGGTAARLAGVPTRLACFRDLGFWLTRKQTFLLKGVYSLMTGFLCNANVVKANYILHDSLNPEKIKVIYNGIDSEALNWVEHSNPTTNIGIVGNLTRRVKRTDLFIKAAAIVSRRATASKLTWHIIGDGALRPKYENLAREEGIANKVIFTGRISNVAEYLDTLQVGVLCSDSEGFSNALLEYMLKGCTCVATAVGGNVEAIDHGRTGLLVPPDDVFALADAMEKVVVDIDLRRYLAANARLLVENKFNWEKCLKEHESVFRNEE